MTYTEAYLQAKPFYTNPANLAHVITALVAGTSDLCDNCGFIKDKHAVCEVCESAWADEQAELELEKSFWLAEAGEFKF